MKKYIIVSIILTLAIFGIAKAASVLFPYQGGTGTGTAPTAGQLLIGTSGGIYEPSSVLGLGDVTPDAVLEVTTNASASAYFMVSSDAAGDGDYFIVDGDGNVGIGTASPSSGYKLHILMEAADIMGIYIDGGTNPHDGLLSHALGASRFWDFGTSVIPASMETAAIRADHISSGATVDTSRTITTLESVLNLTGDISNEGGTDLNFFAIPFYLSTINTGAYDTTGAGYLKVQNRGNYVKIEDTSTWTDTSGTGNVNGVGNTGGYFWIVSNPTLTGNAVFSNMGVRILVEGTTVGWSTNYGIYIDKVEGADTNWALYDNTTADSCLHALRIGSEVAPTVALDVTGNAIISADLDVGGILDTTTLTVASTYTFPGIDGTADYVMKTDGSGNLRWATDETGAGAGDVGSVGDCIEGACLDGSSDGGTYIRLYDGDSNYVQLDVGDIGSDYIVNLPTSTGTLVLTTGNVATATALAANGGNCAAGSYPLGVDASGAVESCTDATTEIDTAIATKDECSEITNCVDNAWDALTDMVLTDNYIYVGDVSNDPVGVAMSNDCTIASNGAITCDHDALDNFVVAEHVDWAGAGAGTIHTDNYVEGHGDGANCNAGEIALGVDASGAVEGCYEPTEADITDLAHTATDITANIVDFNDIKYNNTLAGNPALLVDECFLIALATGGGFICEGSIADTSEQLYLFPDVNGVDTTNRIVVDATQVTDIEGTGLSITTGTLNWSASGIAGHDTFTDFVANEHLDWTASVGTIHTGNYIENVSTTLSVGTVGINTVAITSDGGADDVTLPAATVNTAGMLTTAKWAEIVANTAKVTNATHTGDVTGATALTIGNDKVLEAHLKAVDAAADEECLTFETTTGDFEWQACGGSLALNDLTDVTITSVASGELIKWSGSAWINNTLAEAGIQAQDAFLDDIGALTDPAADRILFWDDGTPNELAWLTVGTGLTLSGTNLTADLGTSIDISAETNLTAGRSLTMSADSVVADAELYVYKAKIAFEDPTATDDFFFGEIGTSAVTFTSIYCKTLVGTVDLDVQIAGSDINGTDITCNTSGVLDDSLGGDTAGATGEEVKLAVTSVASSPTYLMVILRGTYND